MLCYKDKTFCIYYKSCKDGKKCERSLTDERIKEAQEERLYISSFIEKPVCYKE